MGKKDNKDLPLARGLAAYQNTMTKQEDAGESPGPAETEAGKDAVEGLLKTGQKRPPGERPAPQRPFFRKLPTVIPRAPGEAAEEDSKTRRVAKFLILIGGDEAAGILSQLDLDQVEALSREIATIRGISGEEAAEIFAEFRSLLPSSYGFQGVSSGGVETARRLLYTAFGEEDVLPASVRGPHPVRFLAALQRRLSRRLFQPAPGSWRLPASSSYSDTPPTPGPEAGPCYLFSPCLIVCYSPAP
jgi:hypothetical protein